MKIKAALLVALSCLVASSAYGESGYTISRRNPYAAKGLAILSSSRTGWVLTTGDVNGVRSTVLHGPGGYTRDLSKLEQFFTPGTNDGLGSISASKVDGAGTVYFVQNVFATVVPAAANEPDAGDGFLGNKLFKLPLGATSLTQSLQQSDVRQLITELEINDAGQFVYRTPDPVDSVAALTVQRFSGRPLAPVSVVFPAFPAPRRSSQIELAIDQGGWFVVYRRNFGVAKQRPGLELGSTGLCTGSLNSEAVRCMKPAQLRRLSAGGYGLSKVGNGVLFFEKARAKGSSFKSINLANFERIETFSLKYVKSDVPRLVTSDGSIVTNGGGLDFSNVVRIRRRGSDGVERTFRCVVDTPVRWSDPLGFGALSEGPNGKLTAALELNFDSAALFDLTPAEVPASATATPGLCLQVRR